MNTKKHVAMRDDSQQKKNFPATASFLKKEKAEPSAITIHIIKQFAKTYHSELYGKATNNVFLN